MSDAPLLLTAAPMTLPTFAQARWNDRDWTHRKVMSLFGSLNSTPDADGNSTARRNASILYRIEPAHCRVLIQSTVEPDPAQGVTSKPLAPALARLEAGVAVQLLLEANPARTVNRTGPDGKVHRKRAQPPADELPAWFTQRLEGAISVDPSQVAASIDYPRRGKHKLFTATFRAVGVVDDPQATARAIRDGVGRAKPYGCGMLTALPV